MFGKLIGNFVSFEHVLECPDPETKILGDAHEHLDLILPVRMTVDDPFPFEYFKNRFSSEVAARTDLAFPTFKILPRSLVIERRPNLISALTACVPSLTLPETPV